MLEYECSIKFFIWSVRIPADKIFPPLLKIVHKHLNTGQRQNFLSKPLHTMEGMLHLKCQMKTKFAEEQTLCSLVLCVLVKCLQPQRRDISYVLYLTWQKTFHTAFPVIGSQKLRSKSQGFCLQSEGKKVSDLTSCANTEEI